MENNKKYYIYKITLLKGSLAGKYYFGKRHLKKDQNNPMTDGYYGSGAIVKKYYKKYPFEQGVTAIKEVLEYNSTEEENREREIFYIGDKYETDPDCLNLKSGGFGGVLSNESKEKLSKTMENYYKTDIGLENRKKKSDALRGKVIREGNLSESHKTNIRISLAGRKKSEEQKKKQSESMKGKSHPQSEETRLKISNSIKKMWQKKAG